MGLIVVLSLVAACGSNQAKEKLALAADTTTTETVTEPVRTVTAPTRTQTVTKTETTTAPGKTTTIQSNTTSVKVNPTTSTNGGGSSGGIPSWAWVLIGAGAVVLVVAIFMLGRTHGARARDATGAPPAPGDPYDPRTPRSGPPEDPI